MTYELECEKECPTCGQVAIRDKEGHYRPLDHAPVPEEKPTVQPEPEPHSYALLKLEGAAKPLFFVMEERYGKPDEDDYQGHRRYFYEEHSCPTNWLGHCVAIIEAGDRDPHGFLSFVRSVPIPADCQVDHNGEPDWEVIFPEAFPSPQKE